MTKDEIKQSVTMREVLALYGLKPNRRGYITCPFHNETKPSMVIHKDRFYCFGCHASGDIFDFVMNYDGLSFADAIKRLGGNEKPSFTAFTKARQRRVKQKRKREKKERIEANIKKAGCFITAYRNIIAEEEAKGNVFSELWCYCINNLQYQLYLHEHYSEERR